MLGGGSEAKAVAIGQAAPAVVLPNQKGEVFDLKARQGKWTVLYFYPKADTPGCTKQACAFRDSIQVLRELGAEVYGVSSDDVPALAKFHAKHALNFDLLADKEAKVISAFGAKMPLLGVAKRWTFVIGPELTIRHVEKDVDPVKDAEKMAAKLRELQNGQ